MTIKSKTGDELALRRPGAPAGNPNVVKSGFCSHSTKDLKLRARKTRRLVVKAYAVCPWLTETDMPTVRAWGEIVILKAIAFNALDRVGIYRVDPESNDIIGRRLLADYRQLYQTELAYAKELGFTPATRAPMRVDALTGDDLAARASKSRNGS